MGAIVDTPPICLVVTFARDSACCYQQRWQQFGKTFKLTILQETRVKHFVKWAPALLPFIFSWFAGNMDETEAANILGSQSPGHFLIRISSSRAHEGVFVLAVKTRDNGVVQIPLEVSLGSLHFAYLKTFICYFLFYFITFFDFLGNGVS